MTQYDLGQVVGADGQDGVDGSDGSTIWYTSTAPTYANSKYTFTISNLSGKTGFSIAVSDLIFYDTYYYIVSAVNSTTVDCATRVSIKGSDASVDIVTSWSATTSDSKVPSEKLSKTSLDGKLDNAVSSTAITIASNDNILVTDYSDSNKVKRVANILASQVKDSTAHTNIGSSASDTQASINSSIDTALSNKVSKSNTSGLLKNDGTVDTTSYSTFSGSYSDLSNKPSIPSSSSDLSDGSSLVKTSSTTGLLKNDGSVDTNSYLTTSSASSTYQTKLVSGTSIKTINNESLLGSGNISVGGSSVDIVTAWESTPSDSKVASEKLTKNTIDGKLDNALSSTVVSIASNDDILITDYSDSNKIKRVANILASQVKDGTAHSNIGSSANDTQATINTDINTALGNKVSKSQTSGLLKNDGTVDTSAYITSSAITGMLTTSDIANNLTTTTTGKVLDATQGKALADLIGNAITYINQ